MIIGDVITEVKRGDMKVLIPQTWWHESINSSLFTSDEELFHHHFHLSIISSTAISSWYRFAFCHEIPLIHPEGGDPLERVNLGES